MLQLNTRRLTLGPGPCGLRAGLATQGSWHNLRGKVEEVSQVLDTLIGEVPVEMTPGKLLLDIPTGLQRLQGKAQQRIMLTTTINLCKIYLMADIKYGKYPKGLARGLVTSSLC